MGKKKARVTESFILYDIVYQDGTRSSRRKIAAEQLDELDGDKAVRGLIEEQDRKIAEKSGVQRAPVKSFTRSPG